MKTAKLFLVFLLAVCIGGCSERVSKHKTPKVSEDFVVLDSNSLAYKYLFYKQGTKDKYPEKQVKITKEELKILCMEDKQYKEPEDYWNERLGIFKSTLDNKISGIMGSCDNIYDSPNRLHWQPLFYESSGAHVDYAERDLACVEVFAEIFGSSTDYMAKTLEEKDFNSSRSGMILAIGMLGDNAKCMIPILITKLSHFPTVVSSTSIGERVQTEFGLLEDNGYDSEGKTLIVMALGKIALESEELRPQILKALRDRQGKDPDTRVETAILEILWLLGDKDEEKLSLMELRRHIWLLGIDKGDTLDCARDRDQIGEIKDKYAVSTLIRCLRSPYWCAPGNAALALGNFKDDPRAVPALVDATGCKYNHVKYRWSVDFEEGIDRGLKKLGFDSRKQTIPILIKNLKSKDREVLFLSIGALKELGPVAKDSLPKLEKIAKEDQEKYFCDLAESAIKDIKGTEKK